MSGPETFRGVDYQITYSIFRVLQALANEPDLESVIFDSLDDEGEDVTLRFVERPPAHIQVKKRGEGYTWTIAQLRPVILHFSKVPNRGTYHFVTDAPGNVEVRNLRMALAEGRRLDRSVIQLLTSEGCDDVAVSDVLRSLTLSTRCFPSDDDADPAKLIRSEVRSIILRAPFRCRVPIEKLFDGLYRLFFGFFREGRTVAVDVLRDELLARGALVQPPDWDVLPRPVRFFGSTARISSLAAQMVKNGLLLLIGIAGAGKSTTAAEIAARLKEQNTPVCWLPITEVTGTEEIATAIAECAESINRSDVAERIRGSKSPMSAIEDLLRAARIGIFFDSIEKAGPSVLRFIQDLVTRLHFGDLAGCIILTTRKRPGWTRHVSSQLPTRELLEVEVRGLEILDAAQFVAEGVGISSEVAECYARRVGGHPLTLLMLKELARNGRGPSLPNAFDEDAIEKLRDWVVGEVIEGLPPELRRALAALSIFSYPFDRDLAGVVIKDELPLALRGLIERELLHVNGAHYDMHDVVRLGAQALLGTERRNDLHWQVAQVWEQRINDTHAAHDFVEFELGTKWVQHLEQVSDLNDRAPAMAQIRDLGPKILRALDAIEWLGFPYGFDDPFLDETWAIVDDLYEWGWIMESPLNEGKDVWVGRPFQLAEFTFGERFLISCLCLYRGYGESVGYLPVRRPNYAFCLQRLTCPWEHYVELMPLPYHSRADYEEFIEKSKRILADSTKTLPAFQVQHYQRQIEQGVPDDAPMEDDPLRHLSCPIWGHACPGGEQQASVCRAADTYSPLELDLEKLSVIRASRPVNDST